MRAECQFASAGQGLFYNGILTDKNRRFSFVYDCGTRTEKAVLQKSVEDYRDIVGDRIDLLAISHFHADHVSHIPELIKDKDLGIVVIPYVSDEIRLLMAAQADEGMAEYEEYISLCRDPIEYFGEKAEHVVYAFYDESDDKNKENIKNHDNNENHDDNNSIQFESITLPGNYDITLCWKKRREKFKETEYAYYGAFGIKIWGSIWEFRFKNLHKEDLTLTFYDEITKLLDENNYEFKKILEDINNIARLRKIYQDNFTSEFNNTSMAMLSGPLVPGRLIDKHGHIMRCRHEHDMHNSINCKWPCGFKTESTLLLGDLQNWTGLKNGFFDKNILPIVIQLPHHGAKNDKNIVDTSAKVLCKRLCDECKKTLTMVASYGLSNGYGHPDLSWLEDIPGRENAGSINIELVNERNDFSYTIHFG